MCKIIFPKNIIAAVVVFFYKMSNKSIDLFRGLLLAFLLCLPFLSAAAVVKPAGGVPYATADKPLVIDASKSSQLTVYLKSNPTTGFSWYLTDDYPSSWLRVISHKFVAPKTKLMGAPGYEVWTFQASPDALQVPRVSHISFIYARSWEVPDAEPLKISFYVEPKDSN